MELFFNEISGFYLEDTRHGARERMRFAIQPQRRPLLYENEHRSDHPAINCRAISCRPAGTSPVGTAGNSLGFQP